MFLNIFCILMYWHLTCFKDITAASDDDLTFSGPKFDFTCPEENGLFADPDQCDLYYECKKGVYTVELCKDGLLFDTSIRNHEKCVLPHNVDCGNRKFVQEPQTGIDPKCQRANGFFDHEDETVCNKFYNCVEGIAHEMPCAFPLVFDSVIGGCVREISLSPEAKHCNANTGILKTVDGFTCPGNEVIGPNGLLQQHPIFPHPTDCRYFFTCFYGKEPNKFGCSDGQVFNKASQTCKAAEEVSDCQCWYYCGDDSDCPEDCNTDCTCPAK